MVGFRQRSLALVADAFHVASDIIGFVVALIARLLADRKTGIPSKQWWQNALLCSSDADLSTFLLWLDST